MDDDDPRLTRGAVNVYTMDDATRASAGDRRSEGDGVDRAVHGRRAREVAADRVGARADGVGSGANAAGRIDPVERIAVALERIADALTPRKRQPKAPVVISDTDRAAARKVARELGLVVTAKGART
jgi:hypothetical protein